MRSLSATLAGSVPAAVILILAACAVPGSRPAAPADSAEGLVASAERRLRDPDAGAADHARAGWLTYLLLSDLAGAEAHFLRGAALGPDEPYSRLGLAESASARADDRRAVTALMSILLDTPAHPLAGLALRKLSALSGISPALDLDLDAGLSTLLGGDAPGALAQTARLELGRLRERRGDLPGATRARAGAGLLTRGSLAGPLSAFHHLDFAAPSAADQGDVPAGARPLVAPDGWIAAAGEPPRGDGYALLTDVDASSAGPYRLLVEGGSSIHVAVDGVPVLSRRAWEGPAPEETVIPLRLSAGTHRIAVRFVRGASFRVALAPEDGLPAELRERPAAGPRPAGTAQVLAPSPPAPGDPRDPVAPYLRAQALARVDRDAAMAQVERALAAAPRCGPCLLLRSDLVREDPDVPSQIARGRVLKDVDAGIALGKNHAAALLSRAANARQAERFDDAARDLSAAFQAAPGSARVALGRARLALARGDELGAQREVAEAENLEPGRCDAAELALDLARRRQDLAGVDRAVTRSLHCSGGRKQLAAHRRSRGDLAGALALYEELRDADPDSPSAHVNVVEALEAMGDHARAAETLRQMSRAWPRLVSPHMKLAEVLELAGDAAGAAQEREEALRLEGGDVSLRRAHDADQGKEPLSWASRDGRAAIEAYQKARAAGAAYGDVSAVTVLDHAAVEAHPDGSWTELVHTVTHVLDRRAVEKHSEVGLPDDAEVLWLRTIKADGTALEPESLAKEGHSLPGVEPGDFVEYAYLAAHAARGPALPGFSAGSFFFKSFDVPLFETSYMVRAPAGLEVDLHNFPGDARVASDGGTDMWQFTAQNVPAFIAEPRAVQESEYLPFAQVGAGAGLLEYGRALGDQVASLGRVNREVRAFAGAARASSAGADTESLVRAVAAKVADTVRGRAEGGEFAEPATAALARGRGSRLMVLRAALAALGIPSRVALVRTFGRDPAAYRFPRAELYGLAVLAVDLGGGRTCWMDTSVRQNPSCRLPAHARGREALFLAEPGGRDAALELTPAADTAAEGRDLELEVALAENGTLAGTGVERYSGFDAAQIRAALEPMDADRRRQAVEQMLSRSLRGLVLEDLSVEDDGDFQHPIALRYKFRVADFARPGAGRMVAQGSLSPSWLARRFLTRGERKTPLLIEDDEQSHVRVRLALPPGWKAADAPLAASLETPFGTYRVTETRANGRVAYEEILALGMRRVQPAEYAQFARFATGVDALQQRELVFEGTARSQAAVR